MANPVLHLVAGANGSGKSTLVERVIGPVTNLPFVNADVIATERWPDDAAAHAYEAAALAAEERDRLIGERASFITETVFSHPSKITLIESAQGAGYIVTLHAVMIPEDLAVARVSDRVDAGGHSVPEAKIRARYQRLWSHVRQAIELADEAYVYDNSSAAAPLRVVAEFRRGKLVRQGVWPPWTPSALRGMG